LKIHYRCFSKLESKIVRSLLDLILLKKIKDETATYLYKIRTSILNSYNVNFGFSTLQETLKFLESKEFISSKITRTNVYHRLIVNYTITEKGLEYLKDSVPKLKITFDLLQKQFNSNNQDSLKTK